MRQTTCNWIKKILDKATRIVNLFLISWFFYLFLLCSISLLVKYNFILRYEALVNAIRTSGCIKNFLQISAKPIAFQRNLVWKLSRNRLFFTNRFSANLASKIPAKFLQNRPFFPRICPWKSREIWLFSPWPTRGPDRRRHPVNDRRLLCLSRFSFLSFVLQVCLMSCLWITLPFLARLWSKQNWETCLPFWTRLIKPFYLRAGLHGETWECVCMFQNDGQVSPCGAERTY